MILKDFASLSFLIFDVNDFKVNCVIDRKQFINNFGLECRRRESSNLLPNDRYVIGFYEAFKEDNVTREILFNVLTESAKINPSKIVIVGNIISIDDYIMYSDFESFWHSKIVNIDFHEGVIVLEGNMYKMIFEPIFH
jgi:hypothetical protein